MMTNADPSQPARRMQFRLRHLLVLPVLLAVFFACGGAKSPLFGLLAVVVLLMVVEAVSDLRFRAWEPIRPYGCLLIVTCVALLALIALDCSHPGPDRSHRAACCNNLRQLALALLNYHETYGAFPPAYVASKQGRPMHSWRVLILPYINQRGLYERYRFDEPWNGPHNRQLVKECPALFRCPADQSAPPGRTNYVAVVGPDTAWPGATGRTLDQFPDGLARTLMLVEVTDASISWLEPRDLVFEKMPLALNAPNGRGVSSRHPGGVNCAFADGHIAFLSDTISEETLRKMLRVDDGEPVGEDW